MYSSSIAPIFIPSLVIMPLVHDLQSQGVSVSLQSTVITIVILPKGKLPLNCVHSVLWRLEHADSMITCRYCTCMVNLEMQISVANIPSLSLPFPSPFLPILCFADLQVLAIDLPGHGLSSHRPPGAFYHVYDYIADLKYVVDGGFQMRPHDKIEPLITTQKVVCTIMIIFIQVIPSPRHHAVICSYTSSRTYGAWAASLPAYHTRDDAQRTPRR